MIKKETLFNINKRTFQFWQKPKGRKRMSKKLQKLLFGRAKKVFKVFEENK